MKAFVDKEVCIGCGACTGVCPDVFEMDNDGLAVSVVDTLTDDMIESAQEAREMCPVEAISVE